MCLIGWSMGRHPRWRAIIAGNRDELRTRPTLAAHWWHDREDVYGGRDAEAGGGWMALRRDGRLAALTNYRERWVGGGPPPAPPGAPSRGRLVEACLASRDDASTLLDRVAGEARRYAGFNLIVAELAMPVPCLHWLSNRAPGAAGRVADDGLGGVSNHLLGTDWPKQRRLSAALRDCEALDSQEAIEARLLDALADDTPPPDDALPDTGVGLARERMLAPPFIAAEHYGTRSSTLILVDRDGRVRHLERTWLPRERGFDHEDRRTSFTMVGAG